MSDNQVEPPAVLGSPETGKEKKKEKKVKDFWLSAWRDHLAGVKCFSPCMVLADLNGNGDNKLIIGNQKQLSVYSGTGLSQKRKILLTPTAMATIYTDYKEIRRPLVVIASGPFIFMYQNLEPAYRYSLPQFDISQKEQEVWAQLKRSNEHTKAIDSLEALKDEGVVLSSHSTDYLAFETDAARQDQLNTIKLPLEQSTVATCMAVLKKDKEEAGAIGCLVVGTENGKLLILESGSTILKKISIPSVPVHIITTGAYNVEYRIIVACRNGSLYAVKNGDLLGIVLEVGSQPVAMARMENQIVVGTMANTMHYFHMKGKKQGVVYLPSAISDMCSMYMETTRSARAIVVALANGEIRVYVGKALMNKTQVYDVVTGMQFGRYGREDSTLILVLKSGSIVIKMLPRTASLEPHKAQVQGPPPEQDVPLKVPKRTELYVQQTAREKEFGVDMHRIFQRDLYKLRLQTARAYAKVLTGGQGGTSHNVSSSIRLTASVQGLGPLFKIKLIVQNTGAKVLTGIPIIFTFNQDIYKLPQPYLSVPTLVPSLVYNFEIPVECVDEEAGADVVKVYVCNPHSSIPIITAIVNMPLADFLMAQKE